MLFYISLGHKRENKIAITGYLENNNENTTKTHEIELTPYLRGIYSSKGRIMTIPAVAAMADASQALAWELYMYQFI